jgi:hypothetical protein
VIPLCEMIVAQCPVRPALPVEVSRARLALRGWLVRRRGGRDRGP